jgi:hypothetical protein
VGAPTSGRLLSVAFFFLILVLVAATSLGSGPCFLLAIFPRLWGGWSMPGTALGGPGTLVCQAEELGDILDVVCGELFQHLLIFHALHECNYNRSIRNMRDSIVNLGEPLDEGA